MPSITHFKKSFQYSIPHSIPVEQSTEPLGEPGLVVSLHDSRGHDTEVCGLAEGAKAYYCVTQLSLAPSTNLQTFVVGAQLQRLHHAHSQWVKVWWETSHTAEAPLCIQAKAVFLDGCK
jgi:hypothetical protein